MITKKQNLINGLKKVVHALKTDTIHYSWKHQDSCNCGVIAQVLLNKSKNDLSNSIFDNTFFNEDEFKKYFAVKEAEFTWKNAVKVHCPITGKPMHEVFKQLFERGLSKEDIVHLEYLENPAILAKSGIKLTYIDKEEKDILKEKIVTKTWYGKNKVKEVWEKKIVETEKTDEKYYSRKDNLIKYLIAWIEILESEPTCDNVSEETNVTKLHEMELNAVAEEKYELATQYRDQINKLSNKI